MESPTKHEAFYPWVIACGHRHVLTKSGHSFPAFLIRLPPLVTELTDHDPRKDDGGSDGAHSSRYFWRTKRDFILVSFC